MKMSASDFKFSIFMIFSYYNSVYEYVSATYVKTTTIL